MSNVLKHFQGNEIYQKVIDLTKWSFTMPMSRAVKSLHLGKVSELILVVFALLFADTTIILLSCGAFGILLIIGLLYICALWIPKVYRVIIQFFR